MKLSVITINYNNREGLQKTIESVVNQTWQEFEYIVIDGGSTDGSVDVIKQYSDRIDYWVSEPDKGIYNAMNKGIDIARGEYSIFINSGDSLYSSDILSTISDELVGTDIITGTLVLDNGEQWYAPTMVTIPYMYNGISSLSHPASFIRTKLLKKYHYDENLKVVSDWKFFVQVILFDGASYKASTKIISIFDTSGISSSNIDLCRKERQNVLENDFPKSIFQYYIYNTKDYDAQLYNLIRESKYRKLFYSFNILLVKLLGSIIGKSSVKPFPFNLK